MFGNKPLENLHVETLVNHVDPNKPHDGTARALPSDPFLNTDQDSIEPTTNSFNSHFNHIAPLYEIIFFV